MKEHHEAERLYLEERVPHIETKALKRSSVPMPIYLQEADSLALWCLTDRKKLFAAGLEREVIDALPERIDLARRAETFRKGFVKRRKTDTAYVRKLSAQARKIKGELVRDLRFAMKRSGEVEDGLLRYIEKSVPIRNQNRRARPWTRSKTSPRCYVGLSRSTENCVASAGACLPHQ